MALIGSRPTVINLALTLADTEYSQLIPTGTKLFEIQSRDPDAELKFSYIEGQSGSVYKTIPAGASFDRDNVNTAPGTTLYIQSDIASNVAEITLWAT